MMGKRHLSEAELVEYADGGMSAEEVARTEEHLRRCDTCAAALAASRQVVAMVGRLEAVAAPQDLRRRVADLLAAQPGRELACPRAVPLLQEYLDGCISPVLVAPLERHISTCGSCRAELTSLSGATRLVRSLTPVSVPAGVQEAVAAARRIRVREVARPLRLRPALVAVAAVGVAALLLFARPAPQPATPAAPRIMATRPTPSDAVPSAQPERVEPARRLAAAVADIEAAAEPQPTTVAQAHEPPVSRPRSAPRATDEDLTARPASASPPPAEMIASRPLPVAMQALRTVASAAEYDREAQWAMDLAAERFATLRSEEVLDRMPDPSSVGPAEMGADTTDVVSPVQPPVTRPEATGDAERSSASTTTGVHSLPAFPPLA